MVQNPFGNDLFKEVNFKISTSVTISAGSAQQITIDTYSCPSDYYPIGYRKIEVGNYKIQLEKIEVTESGLYMRLGNVTSGAITCNPEATVIFAKKFTVG